MERVTAKKKRKHVCVGGLGRWDLLYCQANILFPDILTIKNISLIFIFFRKKKFLIPLNSLISTEFLECLIPNTVGRDFFLNTHMIISANSCTKAEVVQMGTKEPQISADML